jgi:hypothetical protein
MQVDVRLNDDNTEAAIFFPDPAPGYTIIMNAEQCEELIGVLVDVRRLLEPPPALPGEMPLDDEED